MSDSTIAFPDFPDSFRGVVVRPGDDGYAEAREIPNARHDQRQPALIARVRDADDVVTVVNYANEKDIPLAVRGGGHGIDGYAMPADALVVDMSLMKGIEVDASTGRARIQPGVLLGEMDQATQEHGLAIPAGTVSDTGATGLILGGGIGYNSRRYGMSVDNFISADVVTMDGRKLHVSEDENADLFWGLRGAGHNLAIATQVEMQAHPVGPEVTSGLIIFPIEQSGAILDKIDDYLAEASRALTLYPVILPAPPLPGLPEALVGVPIFVLIVVYTGPGEKAEEVVASVAALGEPMANMVGPQSWVATNGPAILDVLAPPGRRQHSRGGYLPGLTREIAEIVVERVNVAPPPTGPGPSAAVAFPTMGGKVDEGDEDAMAFSRVGSKWLWEVLGQWDGVEHDEAYDRWVDDTMDALKPFSLRNGYVNLSTNQGPDWLEGLYGSPEKWDRLRRLKAEWDPHNRLQYNKNIPAAETATAA